MSAGLEAAFEVAPAAAMSAGLEAALVERLRAGDVAAVDARSL